MQRKYEIPCGAINWAVLVRECLFVNVNRFGLSDDCSSHLHVLHD